MTSSSLFAAHSGKDEAAKVAPQSQDARKCKYCNYEHRDEFDLRSHQQMHRAYCEEKEVMHHEDTEYEAFNEDNPISSPFEDTAKIFFELGSSQRIAIIFKLAESKCNLARLSKDLDSTMRSEEHTSELQSRQYLVCRLLLEKKNIGLPTT